MKVSGIFAQSGGYGGSYNDRLSYDYAGCGYGGPSDADYYTGLRESRNGNYRYYDKETDLIDLFG
jgi:hypothetical protein